MKLESAAMWALMTEYRFCPLYITFSLQTQVSNKLIVGCTKTKLQRDSSHLECVIKSQSLSEDQVLPISGMGPSDL